MMKAMRARVLSAVPLLLVAGAVFCERPPAEKPAVAAEEQAVPLEKVLYPAGVPPRENPYEDGQAAPEIVILGSASAAPERTVVLYAERFPNPVKGEDSFHTLFVALIGGAAGSEGARVLDRHDITQTIKTFMDEPGHVYDIRGAVTPFALPGDEQGVDVSARVRLSGTGGISETDDWLYRITPEGKLAPLLTLAPTATYWRSGTREFEEAGGDLLVENPATGGRLIVTSTTRALDPSLETPKCVAKEPEVYRYRDGRYVREGTLSAGELEKLRPSLTALPRLQRQVQPCQ